jgi:hypothetical protein
MTPERRRSKSRSVHSGLTWRDAPPRSTPGPGAGRRPGPGRRQASKPGHRQPHPARTGHTPMISMRPGSVSGIPRSPSRREKPSAGISRASPASTAASKARAKPGPGLMATPAPWAGQNFLAASRAAACAACLPASASAVARSGRKQISVVSVMPAHASQSLKYGAWKSEPNAAGRPVP